MQDKGNKQGQLETSCQQCDRPIVLTDADRVTTKHREHVESVSSTAPNTPLDGSYVDVRDAARAAKGIKPKRSSSFQDLAQVLELATTETHFDHPLCAKCLDSVGKELQERAAEAEQLTQAYADALAQVQEEQSAATNVPIDAEARLTEPASGGLPPAQLRARLEQAEKEEKVEQARARQLEAELERVEAELRAARAEEAAVAEEEAAAWRRFNALALELQDGVEELDAVQAKTEVAARHLDALRQTSVLEDCFHIWFSGKFGTISGFRLGRQREEVPWAEVNAAWGQAALLLDMLARLYEFTWPGGVLKPLSSYSEICDGKMDHKLYGPPTTFWSASFNQAMLLFLACLDSFANFIKGVIRRDGKPELAMWNHIDVKNGQIGQAQGRTYSIRYSGVTGSTDDWNKALKLMLVNLKSLLAWVSKDKGIVGADSMAVSPRMQAHASGSGGGSQSGFAGLSAALTQSMRQSMLFGDGRGSSGADARGARRGAPGAQSMYQL